MELVLIQFCSALHSSSRPFLIPTALAGEHKSENPVAAAAIATETRFRIETPEAEPAQEQLKAAKQISIIFSEDSQEGLLSPTRRNEKNLRHQDKPGKPQKGIITSRSDAFEHLHRKR
mmetsp:Transcript_18233/g.73046  ORF Transcript_18233/g.73046 Transcript_18233/m.73046 type:complete len:118 (+) Transcript_18233:2161-2514(+)